MTLDALTLSRAQQRQDAALECYRIAAGDTVWRYTSAESDVLADLGDGMLATYASAAIGRSGLAYGPEDGRRSIDLTLPLDSPLAARFTGLPGQASMVVSIWRRYASEDVWNQLWAGRVIQAGIAQGRLVCRCEPATVSLKRLALRRRYTRTCPHVLYGPECKAAPQSATGVIVSEPYAGYSYVEVGQYYGQPFPIMIDPPPSDDYAGGWLVAPDGAAHMIEKVDSGLVTLLYAAAFNTGDVVTLYKGCDHSLQTCQSRFGNELNFGGFPWLPRKNPFVDSVF